MANYELTMLNTTTVKDLTVTARPIYGSSRLGVDSRRFILWTNGNNVSLDTPSVIKHRTISLKSYELSNHLGNVLVTVSDKRIAKSFGGPVGPVDYFEPEITTISDYYAFGSPMPTRTWTDPNSKYKYGFNGMEKDNDINVDGGSYDFGARIYDSRLGRWLSMDPMSDDFVDESPYIFCYNNPIVFVDEDGEWGIWGMLKAGVFEYAGQVTSNLISGKTFKESFFSEVDFADVGMSTLQGALDPRAGSKRWVKIGAKVGSIIIEYLKASVDAKGSGEKKNVFDGSKSLSEANGTFAISLSVNYAGNKITKKISNSKIAKSTEVNQYSAFAKTFSKQAQRAIVNNRPKGNIQAKIINAAAAQLNAVKAADKITENVKMAVTPIANTVQNVLVNNAYPSAQSPSTSSGINSGANSSNIKSMLFKPIPADPGHSVYFMNPERTQIYNKDTNTIQDKKNGKWVTTKTHANIDTSKQQLIKR